MKNYNSQDEQNVIRVGQLDIKYLHEAGNGFQMGCFEMLVPPGANVPPPHSHSENEELLYVLEGMLRYTVDSVTRDLKPGDSMVTPRGAVHGFSNPHSEAARALVVLSPDTIGSQYFRDVGSIINAGGPPDRSKLIAVMESYHLVPAAPAVTSHN
jgi:quercetin dioxygenase-like cupin family protein